MGAQRHFTGFLVLAVLACLLMPSGSVAAEGPPWPVASKELKVEPFGSVEPLYDFERTYGKITAKGPDLRIDTAAPILWVELSGPELTIADPAKLRDLFKIHRITGLDPVTAKPSHGEDLQGVAIVSVCSELPDDLSHAPCAANLAKGSKFAGFVLYLTKPLPFGQRFMLSFWDGGDHAWVQEVTTVPSATLTRGPTTIGLDYILLESNNLPLASDIEPRLFLVEKTIGGGERCLEIESTAERSQAFDAGYPGGARRLRVVPGDDTLGRRLKPGRPYTFRIRGLGVMGGPPATSVEVDAKTGCPKAKGPMDPKDYEWKAVTVSESDSKYFIKLFAQGTEDKKPVTALNLSLKPTARKMGKGWWYEPSLVADIGSDNSQSKNFIHITPARFSRFRTTKAVDNKLSANEFILHGGLETDKDFDKGNWVVTARYQPWFRNLYLSADARTKIKEDKAKREALKNGKKFSEMAPIKPLKLGRGFKPSLAVELGRSSYANGGVVKNKAKTQEVVVPDHDIARIVLHLEGFVEYGRFVFKWQSALRALMEDELVGVLDSGTDTLTLRTVDGFRDTHSLGVDWSFDPDHHYVLGIEYQLGEAPPTYVDVDTVKVTMTFKF